MPTRTVTGKTTIKTQATHGASEFLIKAWHMAMPWCCWLALTFFGLGMYIGLRVSEPGALVPAGFGALAAALAAASFDARLRSHRASWEGRWIGPLTAVAGGLVLCLFWGLGFSLPMVLAYMFGGAVICIAWDGWIAHGDHRDLAATFNRRAPAAGIEGARMYETGRHPAGVAVPDEDELPRRARGRGGRPARSEVVEAGLVLPADPAMTADEVGDHLGHAELVTRSKPGSFALTSSPDDAGLARVRITDPDLLTARPVPWPGPSAPGADMSVPFRLSVLQTGVPFCYRRLPVSHLRVTGKTGSGKTMSLAYNMLAEGITRVDYAAFAADVVKGLQFLGALRPALHDLALTPGEVNLLLTRLHRARLDRCNYLGKMRHTEWFPGCGLVFMDCWLEEAAGILKLLGTSRSDAAAGVFMLADWVEDVNASRSAGMSWTASYQKPDKTQAASTVARSQMGHVCFAVADKDDVQFGLSDLQRERLCRPQLWDRPDAKGMAFFDSETVPEDEKVTPMRFFDWGPGSGRIAAYAAEWQARDRPLDEVTGEAMSWTPPASPTAAGFVHRGPGRPPGSPNGNGAHGPMSPKKRSQIEAEARTREVIEGWRDKGMTSFAVEDLEKMSAYIGKGRTWFYHTLRKWAAAWGIEEDDTAQKISWRILPRPGDQREPGDGDAA